LVSGRQPTTAGVSLRQLTSEIQSRFNICLCFYSLIYFPSYADADAVADPDADADPDSVKSFLKNILRLT
jgi:hypothetical protein